MSHSITDRASRSPARPAGLPTAIGAVRPDGYVYGRAPMLIYWETTLACGLACQHCRATAMPDRDPAELSTQQGLALLDRVSGFGPPYPHLVFTGGDPLRRPDLEILVAAASARGIGASLAPAVTADLTVERLAALRTAGVQSMSLSIDGSDATRHDEFRGVPGTFDLTMRAIEWAHQLDLPLQINTLVTDVTLADLPATYRLMESLGIVRWSLFFLISMGRGSRLREIAPAASERLHHWLYGLSATSPFRIATTEATHFRRVALKRMLAEGMDEAAIRATSVGRGFGIRDGNGIMFIAYDGSMHPSGFLPVRTGNVRDDDVVALYRSHPVFASLRDVTGYKGRCGRCAYAALCGGSRARAYTWTGDFLESDPLCPFVPPLARDRAVSKTGRRW